jgi:hypothetical protein
MRPRCDPHPPECQPGAAHGQAAAQIALEHRAVGP